MAAYEIKINTKNMSEQDIFMSFECSVLSVPIIEGDNIMFKAQVIEYNGKSRTELLITCLCSINDSRMFNKVNKLQKGNKLNIMGNLLKNKEEIVICLSYIVYSNNTNTFSSVDKKDLSKIPWLNQSGHKETTDDEQSHSTKNDPPKFVLECDIAKDTEIIEVSDNDNIKGIKLFLI